MLNQLDILLSQTLKTEMGWGLYKVNPWQISREGRTKNLKTKKGGGRLIWMREYALTVPYLI